jgi:hypothetical protein
LKTRHFKSLPSLTQSTITAESLIKTSTSINFLPSKELEAPIPTLPEENKPTKRKRKTPTKEETDNSEIQTAKKGKKKAAKTTSSDPPSTNNTSNTISPISPSGSAAKAFFESAAPPLPPPMHIAPVSTPALFPSRPSAVPPTTRVVSATSQPQAKKPG